MRTLAIIAEYNPLHMGHVYQLTEARRRAGADLAFVIMSTSLVQRGAPAIVSVQDRVRMALAAGADAVFALPAAWAVQDADHFALGGVAIAKLLQTDAISFGAETDDMTRLSAIAALIEDNPPALQTALQVSLSSGKSYAEALADAVEMLLPGSGDILRQPNNTLGLCYLRAMRRLNVDMEVVPVLRQSAYHAEELPTEGFASATAIRKAIVNGRLNEAASLLPEESMRLLEKAVYADETALDAALLYRLRTMSDTEYQSLPGMGEGLDDRLRACALQATSREELLSLLKTRRYTYARLSRMCMHALLGMTQADVTSLPDTAWLLGFKESMRPYLKQAKQLQLPIATCAAEMPKDARWLETEQRANMLWCMAAHQPVTSVLSKKLIRE